MRQRPEGAVQVVAAVVLGIALIAATYPAWRVLMLGKNPTLEELLNVVCGRNTAALSGTAPATGPPAWLKRLLG